MLATSLSDPELMARDLSLCFFFGFLIGLLASSEAELNACGLDLFALVFLFPFPSTIFFFPFLGLLETSSSLSESLGDSEDSSFSSFFFFNLRFSVFSLLLV